MLSAISVIGMSLPEFLVALFLLVIGLLVFDVTLLGLYSPDTNSSRGAGPSFSIC